jgi:rubrerythrin
MDSNHGGSAAECATTLDNLQAAFNGESNARACYLAFAAQAAAEGFAPIASLFRAAARAEERHAHNHSKVIGRLGAAAAAVIETPVVKSTRENLQAAIQGETYERDVMYPNFIAKAQKDGQAEAVSTFQLALAVEAEHAQLYTEALYNLESLRGGQPVVYYVCPFCGSTTPQAGFEFCPVCSTPEEEFEEIQ